MVRVLEGRALRLLREAGRAGEKLRFHQHGPDELAHYAKKAFDIQYEFPFGWKELEGIHNRTDYDLRRHMEFSGKDLTYLDEDTKERFTPYIIETSAGLTRTVLTLCDAYDEDEADGETRVVLRLHPAIAPVTVGVFPLVKKDGLAELARDIEVELREDFTTFYDQGGAIGRRYRRQDEAGTPYCVTIDYQTKEDRTVTLRYRDSMEQVRVKIEVRDRIRQATKEYQRKYDGGEGGRIRDAEGAGVRQPVLRRGGPERAAGRERVTFYIGFDPTADSLHVGHLLQLFAMGHLQRAGHRPIALIGGGTARIGDPSGKTEMRKILPDETIKANAERFKAQIARFLDFSDGKALMVDNADWLAGLNYIDFLRDIGRHFSVNRMLSFETYKMRLETGLSFIEFNYQSCSPTTSWCCTSSTAAACRWAATTSGATSSPAST